MKRLPRTYFRHMHIMCPLYEPVEGHPATEAVNRAVDEGTAKIERVYHEYGYMGEDREVTIVIWREKRFAVVQKVRSEASVRLPNE